MSSIYSKPLFFLYFGLAEERQHVKEGIGEVSIAIVKQNDDWNTLHRQIDRREVNYDVGVV